MSEKDRFGGRLKRIQESKTPAQNKRPIAAQPKAALAAQRTPKPEPAPRDSTGSIEAWTLGLLGLFLIPMGVSLGFGILVSGFMVLFVTPAVTVIIEDLRGSSKRQVADAPSLEDAERA